MAAIKRLFFLNLDVVHRGLTDIAAQDFNFMTPYCFAANNPIRLIDQDGLGPTDPPYFTGNEQFDAQLHKVFMEYGASLVHMINCSYHEQVDEDGIKQSFGEISVSDSDGNVFYYYSQNDFYDNSSADIVLDGAQSILYESAYTLIGSSQERIRYAREVSFLNVDDKIRRNNLRVQSRLRTPAIGRAIAESMRPMSQEVSRIGGTANKSNARVNNNMKSLGKVGYGMGVLSIGIGAYQIATAEDKSQAVSQQIGGLAGALMVGEMGATWGACVAAVPGAIIGGFIGCIVGGFIGVNAGTEANELIENAIEE
jgi:hypothetical protein